MEALKIYTEWDSNTTFAADKRIPTNESIIDIFKSNGTTSEQIKAHCDLVWESTAFGTNTPRYFKVFKTVPATIADLEEKRNAHRLKNVMMGNKIWKSLSSSFKIEISGSQDEFMRSEENDGPLLWDFIRRRINPTTTVGASRLKDEIESKTASAFGNDILQYNIWFEDTRDKIFKEEGDGYNEYLCSMFRAYMTCDDEEFVDNIKDECMK